MQKTLKNDVCATEIYGTKHCFLTSKIRPKISGRQKFPNFAKFENFVKFCKIFWSHYDANCVKIMFSSVNFSVHEKFFDIFRVLSTKFSPNFDEIWSKFSIFVKIWSKFTILVEISRFCKMQILVIFGKN